MKIVIMLFLNIVYLKCFFQILAEKKRITYDDCDLVTTQFTNFLDVEVPKEMTQFRDFTPYEENAIMDTFLYDRLHKLDNMYAELWKVIKMLLLLSHGQASVERGFSVNKQLLK